MDEIIAILMERDGIGQGEAKEIVKNCWAEMEAAEFDPEICEELFSDCIGLEPDYMIALLTELM